MYKVIKAFRDIQDDFHSYKVGDTFPRDGIAVNEKRIATLASTHNRQHTALIVKVLETVNLTDSPALQNSVEQEAPPTNVEEAVDADSKSIEAEIKKPKRGRKSKEE